MSSNRKIDTILSIKILMEDIMLFNERIRSWILFLFRLVWNLAMLNLFWMRTGLYFYVPKKNIFLTLLQLKCRNVFIKVYQIFDQFLFCRLMPKNRAPRLVFFLPNILNSNQIETQHLVPRQLNTLEKLLPASVECSCEITTQLRFLARPMEIISLFQG